MMRIRKVEQTKLDDLPMTPMIDVVFQLLIFFMLMPMNKAVEGKLFSQMPNCGTAPHVGPPPPISEVRVKLQRRSDSDATTVFIERKFVGEAMPTIGSEIDPALLASNGEKNRELWRKLSEDVAQLYMLLPTPRDPAQRAPVIIDAEESVPWEHVVSIVNGCKEKNIENIEFAANPRFGDVVDGH